MNLNNVNTKIATSDDEFEQSFFQLAYEKLQDKLNNLIPYLVGFEIVNKNDEGTRALGVFGFKSNNNQVIYVPAFFVNGTVKGIDILYSKNNEQFYPLNEDFAELFLKDDATGIGSASHESEKKINQTVQPVDLRDLVRPPRTGKVSYASVIDYVEKADPLTKKAFYEMFTQNDDYMQAVLEFYPLEKVAKALVCVKEAKVLPVPAVSVVEKGQDTKDLTPEQKSSVLTRGYALVDKRSKDQVSKFGLIKYPESFTNPTDSGFYAYLTHTGGLHYGLIITKPLRLDIDFATDDALIIDLDAKQDGQGYRKRISEIFTRNKFTVKDYSEVHKKMTDPAEAEPSFDETYIMLNEKLIGTQPFRVRANFKDHTGVRKLRIEVYDGGYDGSGCDVPCVSSGSYGGRNSVIGHNTSGKPTSGNFYNHPKVAREFVLVITKRPGDTLERKGNEILVPKGFKLFNVHLHAPRRKWSSVVKGREEEDKRLENEYEEEKTRYEQGKPGGRGSLSAALGETHVFPLTVRSNGSQYFVNIGAAKRKYQNAVKAKIALVVEAGLDEKTAEELIDSVPSMGKREGYIKLAYTGDYTWGIQDQQPYGGDLGQPTTDGVGQQDVWGGDQYYTSDPTRIGLAEMPEVQGQNPGQPQPPQGGQQGGIQGAIGQASQLAQGGQKQIFDTHSIATLAKYVSPASKVQGYMPDFVSCLDKLGRMLFLVYWETEKFEEMYGRAELPELVELLTNVFKNLGDLVIFLKRKSPEISINMEKDELAA